jgi:hypothetical protein
MGYGLARNHAKLGNTVCYHYRLIHSPTVIVSLLSADKERQCEK